MVKALKRFIVTAPLALLLLTACGGGGGESTPVPTATPAAGVSDRVQQICREQVQTSFGSWVVNTESLAANRSDPALLTPEHREKVKQAVETFERLRGQALCTLDVTPLEQAGVTDPEIRDALDYVRREVEQLRSQGLRAVRTVSYIPQYTVMRRGFDEVTDGGVIASNVIERISYLDETGNTVRSEQRTYQSWGWALKLREDNWRLSWTGEVKRIQ